MHEFDFIYDTDSIGDYIAQGASAVVLSDAIFNKEAMGQNNLDKIYQLAGLAALRGREAVERLVILSSISDQIKKPLHGFHKSICSNG